MRGQGDGDPIALDFAKMGNKVTPPPESRFFGGGAIVVGIASAPLVAWYLISGWLCTLFLLLPLVLYLAYTLYGLLLLIAAWSRWHGSPVRGLLILSNSPRWKDYIEERWLPRLRDGVVILNWSERKTWSRSLPRRLFYRFCYVWSENRNFNPAVILFRGLRYPYVYRYYYAFRDAKRGHPEALHELETHMFREFSKD